MPPSLALTPAVETTHFGYREVPKAEKAALVNDVFASVARYYDRMNDLMTAGLHRVWKSSAVHAASVRPGHAVLDVAGGTGDLALQMLDQVGNTGSVVLSDINPAMLDHGRRRLGAHPCAARLDIAVADAQALPFRDATFDRITMAFGLRNVTDPATALRSIRRVLKPGGRFVVLEFSTPNTWLRPAYDLYSFGVLPMLGRLVTNDERSYRYLVESIRRHPDQQTLLGMMRAAGFVDCSFRNLTSGIVAVHVGHRSPTDTP